jgi:putative transposase
MAASDEQRVRTERAHRVALFRYQLIREAADPALSTRQRGALVRQIAAVAHPGPFGVPVRVCRQSLDRWIAAWRRGGFTALIPCPRQSTPRTPGEVLDVCAALKRENPHRTAAQVVRIVRTQLGWAPSESTVLRLFRRLDLATAAGKASVFGRFEADRPNELWVGDGLHTSVRIAGRKTYLLAFLDDHSRAVMAARFGYAEDTVRLAAALRPALAARGVPEGAYVDNGSAFVDSWLLRACAKLGIKLIHSTPYRPQGKGKIERFWRTVGDQFLVEVTDRSVSDLEELNRLFRAWVETVYHRGVHSETGQAPIDRWHKGAPFRMPTPADLAEAFLWEEHRVVTRTSCVSLFGNRYEVDPGLIGRRVELVFDPFDLTRIEVRYQGKPAGLATPHRIGRHTHPKARPEPEAPPPAPATGINYLAMIDAAGTELTAARINYMAIADGAPLSDQATATPADQPPGQQDTP